MVFYKNTGSRISSQSCSNDKRGKETAFTSMWGGPGVDISRSWPSVLSTLWRDNAGKTWRASKMEKYGDDLQPPCTPSYLPRIGDNERLAPRCTFLGRGWSNPGMEEGHFWRRLFFISKMARSMQCMVPVSQHDLSTASWNKRRLINAVDAYPVCIRSLMGVRLENDL